jgi:hypothetical protein
MLRTQQSITFRGLAHAAGVSLDSSPHGRPTDADEPFGDAMRDGCPHAEDVVGCGEDVVGCGVSGDGIVLRGTPVTGPDEDCRDAEEVGGGEVGAGVADHP